MSRLPVAALALLVAAGALAAAASAAERYVALGDSFSSGLGAGGGSAAPCRRSSLAYPSIVARERPGTILTFVACAGARTSDVLATQVAALTPQTAFATITVGGNDAGFAEVLEVCARPAWASDCAGHVDAARATVRTVLPGRLSRVYAQIRARAPRATVVVLGYPRLFMGADCDLATWFSRDDQQRLNAAADLLDATIRSRAQTHGLVFASALAPFTGHAVCDARAWLHGLSLPLAHSYHPNAHGHRYGYAPLVRAIVG